MNPININVTTDYNSGRAAPATYKLECLVTKPGAKLPKRAHPTDAGADLYSAETVTLIPGESRLIDTGIAVKIPVGYGGFILNRSSQRVNRITSLGTGLIDSDYRGNLKVFIVNDSNEEYVIVEGETRIGQLVVMPILLCDFTDVWNDTDRGTGGFGSTGK